MRELTTIERFNQIVATESNWDHFQSVNTSTLPEWEDAPAGFEFDGNEYWWQPAGWVPVNKIRYEGSGGWANNWKLR